jgi:uncharacterized membrane protein YhiD involved in acid resistance
MNDFLNLTSVNLDYPFPVIIFNIIFAFLIGLLMAGVYKKNHKGLSYTASFTFTLVLLTVTGSILMMIVGNSLARAFSLFGAFSIIRFRTAVKESKDIAFVFISLILGMAVGTNNYIIAVLSTLFLSLAIIIMTKRNFGSIAKSEVLLTFYSADSRDNKDLMAIFNKYLTSHHLANLVSLKEQKTTEFSYQISLKPETSANQFVQALKDLKGVNNIRLVSLENTSES